MMAPMMPGT